MGGSKKRLGTGIIHHVSSFIRSEIPVYWGEDQSGAQVRPEDFKIAKIVFHQNGDMVAGSKTLTVEELCDAVGALVQFLVGDLLIGAGDNDSGLIRPVQGVGAGMVHGFKNIFFGIGAAGGDIAQDGGFAQSNGLSCGVPRRYLR